MQRRKACDQTRESEHATRGLLITDGHTCFIESRLYFRRRTGDVNTIIAGFGGEPSKDEQHLGAGFLGEFENGFGEFVLTAGGHRLAHAGDGNQGLILDFDRMDGQMGRNE